MGACCKGCEYTNDTQWSSNSMWNWSAPNVDTKIQTCPQYRSIPCLIISWLKRLKLFFALLLCWRGGILLHFFSCLLLVSFVVLFCWGGGLKGEAPPTFLDFVWYIVLPFVCWWYLSLSLVRCCVVVIDVSCVENTGESSKRVGG